MFSCLNARKESRTYATLLLQVWCHQESNRGHKDFQSFALPTELWHHVSCFVGAKVVIFIEPGENMVVKVADFNFFFDLGRARYAI